MRATTRLVEVSVLVKDGSGKPVAGLSREDFVLLEDGKEQAIQLFSEEMSRSTRTLETLAPPLPPNTFSNRVTTVNVAPSVSVILFDVLNTQIVDQQLARRQIITFLKQLKPADRVAIYLLAHGVRVLHDFTGDAAKLLEALEKFQGSASFEADASLERAPAFGELDLDEFFKEAAERSAAQNTRLRIKYSLDALWAIAHHLSPIPGRKNLIWVSGGFPLTIGIEDSKPGDTGFRDRGIYSSEVQRTARAVSQANIAIYPVDARGLFTDPMDQDQLRANMPFFAAGQQSRYGSDRNMGPNAGNQQREGGGSAGGEIAPRISRRELISGRMAERGTAVLTTTHNTMNLLADQTGGRAFYNTNEISRAIRDAIDESEVSYVLGYYPTHSRWTGKFHDIKVRVKRQGVQVRHRKGYFAYPEERSSALDGQAQLIQSVTSPLDARAIALTAALQRRWPRPDVHHISLQLDLKDLWLQQSAQAWSGELDVYFSLTDSRGTVLWSDGRRVHLNIKLETYEHMQKNGLRMFKDIPARKDAELLRVAVRDARSGAIGSVRIPVRETQLPAN